MENGFVLQLLVAAGVVAYGIWNAVQKSAEQKGEQERSSGDIDSQEEQAQMTWEDYFPSSVEMSTQPKSVDQVREVEKEAGSQTKRKNQGKYQLATSHLELTDGSTQDMDQYPLMETDKQEVSNKEVVTDLRTIIISSELLKPKYLEY